MSVSFGRVACRIVARMASSLLKVVPDLRRRRFTRHLGVHEPRPRVGEDKVLDAFVRGVEDVLAELAWDNAARARAARRGDVGLHASRTRKRFFPRADDVLAHDGRLEVVGGGAARHERVVLHASEQVLQHLVDLVFDVDGRLGGEGVDQREVDERGFVEHLPALRGGDDFERAPFLLPVADFAYEDCVFGCEFFGGGPDDQGLDVLLDAELEGVHGGFGLQLAEELLRGLLRCAGDG
jgi:hypothetical protein